jgi:hypothetical protein
MRIDIPGDRKPLVSDVAGFELINHALLNKGTAFTEEERDAFHLHGLLPPQVGTLDVQVDRRMKALHGFATNFQKYAPSAPSSFRSPIPPHAAKRPPSS